MSRVSKWNWHLRIQLQTKLSISYLGILYKLYQSIVGPRDFWPEKRFIFIFKLKTYSSLKYRYSLCPLWILVQYLVVFGHMYDHSKTVYYRKTQQKQRHKNTRRDDKDQNTRRDNKNQNKVTKIKVTEKHTKTNTIPLIISVKMSKGAHLRARLYHPQWCQRPTMISKNMNRVQYCYYHWYLYYLFQISDTKLMIHFFSNRDTPNRWSAFAKDLFIDYFRVHNSMRSTDALPSAKKHFYETGEHPEK